MKNFSQIVANLGIIILCLFLTSLVADGTAYAAGGDSPLPEFDHILMEINGSRTLIQSKSEVLVVKGDLITVIDGWILSQAESKADVVDVIGFSSKTRTTGKDDRGFVINTSSDLQSAFAVDSEKTTFNIRGYKKGFPAANISLKVISPRLDRVDISLNGKSKSLRDGDVLDLRSSDRIAVLSVHTNVRGNESVTHELREKAQIKNKNEDSQQKELVFARNGQVFGRIPIKWRE